MATVTSPFLCELHKRMQDWMAQQACTHIEYVSLCALAMGRDTSLLNLVPGTEGEEKGSPVVYCARNCNSLITRF